ncbi:MAG: hypothetical protein RLP02_30350 [Coleofasciculus sp. C2-GNP5-27]
MINVKIIYNPYQGLKRKLSTVYFREALGKVKILYNPYQGALRFANARWRRGTP